MNLNNLFTQSKFQQYAAFLKSTNLSNASLKRKLSSLSSFQKFLIKKKLIEPNLNSPAFQAPSFNSEAIKQNIKNSINQPESKPNFLKKIISRFIPDTKYLIPNTKPNNFLFRYITIFSLFAIGIGLGFTLYRQAFIQSNKNLAYSTATNKIVPGRFLSFQGRLTNIDGNPIISSTGIVFKLYNNGNVGEGDTLYTSETGNSQTVVPDENGIFSVTIGKSHGEEIPASVFSENREVWLEITAGGETMSPRQPIATVAYAMNAETLQGLPPSASGLKDTVLVIDSEGNINLGETSPSIISNSGTMAIQGQALLIGATNSLASSNIQIDPTSSNGAIQLSTTGDGSSNAVVVTATNLNTGNLILGQISTASRGYNFIDFKNFDIGTSNLNNRFYINSYGDTYVGRNLSVGGTFTGVGSTNIVTNLNASYLGGISSSGFVGVGSTGNFVNIGQTGAFIYTAGNGITLATGNQFKLGGSLTENTSIGTSSFGLSFLDINNNPALYLGSNGYVGIGTTNPSSKLSVIGSIQAKQLNITGDNNFGTGVTYPVGAMLYSITSSDFNGDGKADLATVDYLINTITVFTNTGDGTYGTGVNYSTIGTTPYSITSADFSGDGKADLATANYGNNTITIFINTGDGTFGTGVTYPTIGAGPRSITSSDFNGDGKADLATGNYNSSTITIFTNTGDGTYGTGVTYPTIGISPRSIISGDFSGDGKADLATANYSNRNITVFTNTGDGTYGTGATYSTIGTGPYSITSGDFSGDGKTDLATANYSSNTITVFTNTGNGTYGTGVTYPTIGTTPWSITSGDFSGDGKTDLATANYGNKTITVFTNTGNSIYDIFMTLVLLIQLMEMVHVPLFLLILVVTVNLI